MTRISVIYPAAIFSVSFFGFIAFSDLYPAYHVHQNSIDALADCGEGKVAWVNVDEYRCKST